MKCPNCQTENREGINFCEQCGVKMQLECPVCRARLPLGKKFCGECGQELGEEVQKEKPVPKSEGERKYVTIMFSDLSGYTSMSEKLDPEEVKEITSRIFARVAHIISQYDGFIEKYIGDAVVAIFGVPTAHEDDHLRALRAASEIHRSINAVAIDYEEKVGKRLAFHTGIATGLVVTGEINLAKGTHGLAGNVLNFASRLCGYAKPGEILVGESTYLQSNGTFSFEKLEPLLLKGKAEAVTPYRLLEERDKPSKGLATQGFASSLVGRTAEVSAIKGCINRLLDNQGGILSLIGEAGMGKSRLMAEIQHHFEREDILWLEGRTLSYGRKISYWPFREIIWHFAGITEDDSDTQAWEKLETQMVNLFPTESGEIVPYLAGLIGIEVKGELAIRIKHLDGESMGRQIYLSSRRFFERLASFCPLVLVFEDLHWADESTILLIEHLFPLIYRVPLLLCGVARGETGIPATRLRDIALREHERRYTEIRLAPLSPAECMDLMDNLLPIENLPSSVNRLILAKTEGNPYFVEEIMRTLMDSGAVRYEKGWKVTSRIETITIPDTIQGLITARIDRLNEDLKQILKSASVIGRAFLYRLLKKVTNEGNELDRHLNTLISTELISEKQRVPELEYIFKHALVQESTYGSILLRKRQEIHNKVASAIEHLFADRLDEFLSVLAYHYAKAERWERAQEYLFKAGDQAGRIAADAEALTHYQQALETYTRVFGDKWDPIHKGILERKMGEAFYRRGEYDAAMEYLQSALVCLGRSRLPASPGKVRLAIVKQVCIQVGHRIFSRWVGKKGKRSSEQVVEEVARIYELIATHGVVNAPEHFLLTTLTCLNYSERQGYIPGIVSETASLVLLAHFFSLFRISRFLLRRMLGLMEHTQSPAALVRAYLNLIIHKHDAGLLDEAIQAGLEGIETARKNGYWHLTLWGYLNVHLILGYRARGDIQSALGIAQEMVHIGQDANEANVLACGLVSLGNVQRLINPQEGVANLIRANSIFERFPNHLGRVFGGSFLGECYCRLGETEKSLEVLAETEKYRAIHGVRGWDYLLPLQLFNAYLTAAEREAGPRRDEYLKKAKRASKMALRSVKGYQVSLLEITRLQGAYNWLIGKRPLAKELWQRSIQLAEEMGMRYDLAMTHLEMGRRLNDNEHLKQAEAIFVNIGADFDLEETRRLIQVLSTDGPRAVG